MKNLSNCPYCAHKLTEYDYSKDDQFSKLMEKKCSNCRKYSCTFDKETPDIIKTLSFNTNKYRVNIDYFSSMKGTKIFSEEKNNRNVLPKVKDIKESVEPDFFKFDRP